jgi:hypothetical protein
MPHWLIPYTVNEIHVKQAHCANSQAIPAILVIVNILVMVLCA